MKSKTGVHLLFEVKLNWQSGTNGLLTAAKTGEAIHITAPSEFGGTGNAWSPEHLFLGAVSSCFMTTFVAFAKKFRCEITNFECEAIGQIELINGKFKFTMINLYPKVFIPAASVKEKANLALEKTHKYCIISNSVNAPVFYHSTIVISTNDLSERKTA